MYTSFFGLNEKPFSITPDPRYLFLSERHAEALAHLLYGVTESGGFIQLTGEVGTGKTTIVRSLLEQLPPDTRVALVLNPRLSPHEFLLTICEELRLPLNLEQRGSMKAIVDALNQRLLEAHAAGQRVVLIVDEAQNLSPDVLEQIRLLTNLETPNRSCCRSSSSASPSCASCWRARTCGNWPSGSPAATTWSRWTVPRPGPTSPIACVSPAVAPRSLPSRRRRPSTMPPTASRG